MTEKNHQTLVSATGAKLALYAWPAPKNARGVVHINHGMAEHSSRYARFAEYLNIHGFHVIAHDHRGHGYTVAPGTHLGMFAKRDGWENVLADIDAVHDHIEENHPGLPVIYFGHSMGSIIGVNYCIRRSERLAGAALWNSGVDGGPLLFILSFLLACERMLKGSDVPSGLAHSVTFKTWNQKFAPNRTDFDWLSRDETEVDRYVDDPLCGFPTCNGLWRDLLIGIKTGASNRQLAKIRSDLPIHLLGGGQDPCSDNGKAILRLASRLTKCGVQDVKTYIHPDNRHEALNETSKDEIMNEFTRWLDQHIS